VNKIKAIPGSSFCRQVHAVAFASIASDTQLAKTVAKQLHVCDTYLHEK
jgi:hypothetical protein